MCLILQDGLSFVHIPLGSMVKFQFFAQISVDHILYPVVFSCILLLRKLATFAYYIINGFVSITT